MRILLRLPLPLLLVATVFFAACDSSDDDLPPTETTEVSAEANIFAAGRSSVPEFDGGGGTLPRLIDVSSEESIVFPSIAGTISPNSSEFGTNGPDGGARSVTEISSHEGISGIRHDNTFFFLVGVFLSDAQPAPPSPTTLNVTDAENQSSFSPRIGQLFYIGDGRTASEDLQRFTIPEEGTRLFLGFADTAIEQGAPGFYGDNEGELEVEYRFSSE